MHGVQVGPGARVKRAIIDKWVDVPADVQIGFAREADEPRLKVTGSRSEISALLLQSGFLPIDCVIVRIELEKLIVCAQCLLDARFAAAKPTTRAAGTRASPATYSANAGLRCWGVTRGGSRTIGLRRWSEESGPRPAWHRES